MAGADEIHSKAGGAVGFSQENETVSILLKKPSSARGRRIGLRRGRSVGLEVKRSMDSPEEGSNSSPTSDRDADEGIFGIMAGGGEIRVREGQGTRLPCLSHGAVSLIGRRREMEDAVAVVPGFIGGGGPSEYDFFGVYDGHGGARVAQLCRERLHVVLAEEASAVGWPRAEGRWREVMSASFSRVDGEAEATAQAESERTMGSTAVVAVVGTKRIVVANCGDSRAVLCRGGAALPLSFDHKADRPDEMARVEAAGGRVINWEGYRVLGVLATSRSIGDYYLKPFVISEPDVTVTERTDKDEFLILASDGLWDVVSNEAACKIARQCLNGRMARMFPDAVGGSTATEAAALLAQLAVSRESEDNISVVVVQLKPLHARTSCMAHVLINLVLANGTCKVHEIPPISNSWSRSGLRVTVQRILFACLMKTTCWKKRIHILLVTLKVVYWLNTPKPTHEGEEEETLDKLHAKQKWEMDTDDKICRDHILNAMGDNLFDIYHTIGTTKEL
ncbi:hypothetical protein ZIOFF_072345 [Zingiber officinale]|uniref:protein-serine/threonine phosphatase n=1 Tax=Zingiber officinale TaxID=94328 RepID=A0A8J5BFM0_ZINOF|nr:hypothetical protein ZIOFF_072345 [Zingiber officinale]